MVDSTKDTPKDKTVTPTPSGFDMDSTTVAEITSKVASLVELHQALLSKHSDNLSKVKDPQANDDDRRVAIDALLQQLQSAIDKENSRTFLEVKDMKEMLANLELQLAKMIQSGKSQSMQAGQKTVIDELRSDIGKLEAQTRKNQSVYEDLVIDIKAKIKQRIQEVNGRVEILPFADLQAANEATGYRAKMLEDKLVIAEKEKDDAQLANEQLS